MSLLFTVKDKEYDGYNNTPPTRTDINITSSAFRGTVKWRLSSVTERNKTKISQVSQICQPLI